MGDWAESESKFWSNTCSLTQYDLVQREAVHQETANLKRIAEYCEGHLHKLLPEEEAQDDIAKAKDGHWASRQFVGFNLWCAKVGVHGEGLRSIDIRLKDVPEICNLLGRLLQSLKRDLNQLELSAESCDDKMITDDDANYDEDDAGSNASTLSFETLSSAEHSETSCALETPDQPLRKRKLALQAHIDDTINRLHGHALRIDDAGAGHRVRCAEFYQQREGLGGAYDGPKALALQKPGRSSEGPPNASWNDWLSPLPGAESGPSM
ncbi:hypothetical protein Purlil1_12903 [Purpureocillium lilacinum]|uniref:Uncharacterized protein n=1 Tax=Purpureocillium lilacinum TaxID=33203 RepID=A0ABR0BFI0_PURLI|nr:hypothetical protein Purlil1_12903 [Purpureocillium lilacinum]